MPFSRITLPQRAISSRRYCSNASGVLGAGTTPAPSTPEEFEKYLREENARWGKVIRDKGIKGE